MSPSPRLRDQELAPARPRVTTRAKSRRSPGRPSRGERSEAVAAMAEMLDRELPPSAVVVGIEPAGLALAAPIAARIALPVAPAPVIPLAPPWNAEPVYGAVAFDGSVSLDDALLGDLEIGRRDLERAVSSARESLAAARPRVFPIELARRQAAVVDDGRAPAIAVTATIAALRNAGAERVITAIRDGSCRHLRRLAGAADQLLCPGRA